MGLRLGLLFACFCWLPFDEKGVLRSWIMSTGSGLGLAKKRCNVKACGDRRLVSTAADFCFLHIDRESDERVSSGEKDFIPLSGNDHVFRRTRSFFN